MQIYTKQNYIGADCSNVKNSMHGQTYNTI